MSFVAEFVDAAEPSRLALVAIGRDGGRREIAFGEVADRSARLAGALAERGVARGDVVMTVVGNRPEWAYAMLACWRLGAIALPCTEQLRPADLRGRMEAVDPRAVVADERDLELVAASGFEGPVLTVPDERLFDHDPVPPAAVADDDPALIVFTSGTAGEPKPIRHGHGYLLGQRVQAEHWYGARPGDLCWCTAASGWSLSARNAFVAAWLRGAAALLHDARFDPGERLDSIEREGVNVLCMSPTEYRAIAKRAELRPLPGLRHACAAGEPLNPEVVRVWEELRGDRRPRRLRPDRDRPPHRDADRRARAARLDGAAASGLPRLDLMTASWWWTPRPSRPSSSTARATGRGAPATACARTTTATSGSRAARTM